MAKSFQAQTPYQTLLCSIDAHQRRKECMVRQAQFDINQLLLSNRVQETISKRKHICEDKTRLAAYAQVQYFCSFILQNFSNLKHQRSLFFERFGLQFDRHSVDLRPGNLVSSEIIKLFVKKMPQDAMSPETIVETNIAASVESVTEDSVSTDNLGFRDSDAVKIEIFKTWIGRKNIMKDSSKFLHLNLVVSRKQIDHCS
ncbi:hypothetical protein F2Q68_00003529 [Brassica cretica]|uniref:Uncharacterized protein n=1 Tax=Brassica cretica TaxID=69181 RepID=A0A8S9JHZ5_BRACR|nr:hypothetical protein F2Q68_00003529 [Brassica cretica]